MIMFFNKKGLFVPLANCQYPITNCLIRKYNSNDIYRRFWQLNITTIIFFSVDAYYLNCAQKASFFWLSRVCC